QLGQLRPARARDGDPADDARTFAALRAQRLPLHVDVQARRQAWPVRAPLAPAARAVPVPAFRQALRDRGADPPRSPGGVLEAGLAGPPELPALPAPDRVHRPRARLHDE